MAGFDKNLEILNKRFPSCTPLIDEAHTDHIEIVDSGAGPVPAVTCEGKRLFVHSRYDPKKEAARFISSIDIGSFDLFVVFGFGFGYHVGELLDGLGRDAICIVIEKDPGMLRRAIEHRDLTKILADERFIILINPDEERISEALRGKASRRSSLILHRGSHQADPEWYANMQGIVRSYLSTKEVNIATLAKFEKIWASNLARNVRVFIESPAANSFYGKFKGIPAIVVAAGPSLQHAIRFINENRSRAVIVAVDTSYRLLLREGIEPHFCVSVDPQVANARYFEGVPQTKTVLIADPTVHPSVFRLFRGRVAVTGVAFNLLKWIEEVAGEKGELTHGGSVSTNAYDFAKRLGASPIVLVGQDLAFTAGYAHARGSYLDEQVHLRTGRLYTPEMFNRFQLTALPAIFVRSIRGGTVRTNQKMMIFLSWFEKRRDPDLINATCDGAVIPGVRHLDISQITFGALSVDIDAVIDGIHSSAIAGGKGREELLLKIAQIRGDIETLIPILQRAEQHSEELLGLLTSGSRPDGRRIDFLLAKLSEADKAIEAKRLAKDMISFTAQRVVHTIQEGYAMDDEDEGLSPESLIAKRSLFLYRGILNGARFTVKTLNIMAAIAGRN